MDIRALLVTAIVVVDRKSSFGEAPCLGHISYQENTFKARTSGIVCRQRSSPRKFLSGGSLKYFGERDDKGCMKVLSSAKRSLKNEQGFTLQEVLVVIVIMGILFAIATASFRTVTEGRRVDSGTNQLVADLRLAHSSASNSLAAARVVFSRTGAAVNCNGRSADYCLIQPAAAGPQFIPRDLPGTVRITSPNIALDPGGLVIPGVVGGTTSTIEFTSDGAARTLGAVAAIADNCPPSTPTGVPRIKVTSADDSIRHCVTLRTATSRIKVD